MQKSELLKEMIDRSLSFQRRAAAMRCLKRLNLNKLVMQLVSDIGETHPDKKLPFETRHAFGEDGPV